MATLTIRSIDDALYGRLRQRAKANRRSLEAEVREILSENAPPHDALIEDLAAFHEEMVAKHGYLPDSTGLIRKMRDEE
jgi:plasmid stability protein